MNQTRPKKKIIGYHYSNPIAYKSMQDGREYGKVGLIPLRRLVSLGEGNNLPDKAHEGIIEGLLEPEPDSWLKNPEFPNLWRCLMHDICKEKNILLLSFELKPTDQAYIVERAHVERELYKFSKCQGKPTKESLNEAFKEYWESRVPVLNYHGNYSVPQLAIWSEIEFNRLKVEWIKPSKKVWKNILNRCN